MKMQFVEWTENSITSKPLVKPEIPYRVSDVLISASKTILALLPAFAIVIVAAWLSSMPGLVVYLQAFLWTSGFLFLGLAFDARPPVSALHVATGIALPVLALLSSTFATEIAIVGAMLLAIWVSAGLIRR